MSWRDISMEDRKQFLEEVDIDLGLRQQYGIKTYGNTFIGDPLEHAWQEMLDGLFYIWIAKRERGDKEKVVQKPY